LDDRLWYRASDPTYPGEVDLSDWTAYKEPPFASALLNDYGELATGVPASNHSRWLLCILPPVHGGGAKGSLLLPYLAAIHTSGNGVNPQSHAFDFETGTWSRWLAFTHIPISGGWGNGRNAACYDSIQRQVWRTSCQELQRAHIDSSQWERVPLSGFYGNWGCKPLVHIPPVNVLLILKSGSSIGILDAASPGTSVSAATVSGTPPPSQPTESFGGTWCGDLGPNGSVLVCDYTTMDVYALAVPSDAFSGTWTWSTLTRHNSPSGFSRTLQYNRFQYVPAIQACIVTGGNSDVYAFNIEELGSTALKTSTVRRGLAFSASPNPFRTRVRFSDHAPAVDIFNAAGKRMARLEAGRKQWNAENFPAGVYLVRSSNGIRQVLLKIQ
jgi:hypothetical protein